MSEYHRRLIVSHKAYYAHVLDRGPELSLGYDHEDGGTVGEFVIRWKSLGDKEVPQLRVFDDAWGVLFERFQDLLELLSTLDDQGVTPDDLAEKILALGNIEDKTAYEDPRDPQPPKCPTCHQDLDIVQPEKEKEDDDQDASPNCT